MEGSFSWNAEMIESAKRDLNAGKNLAKVAKFFNQMAEYYRDFYKTRPEWETSTLLEANRFFDLEQEAITKAKKLNTKGW